MTTGPFLNLTPPDTRLRHRSARRIASHRRPPRAMSRASKPPRCVGSPSFRPDEVVDDAPRLQRARDLLAKDDLYEASRALLGLPERDTYTYHATASVKLAEVQHVVRLGGVNGLHGWYRNEDGSPVCQALCPRRKGSEIHCGIGWNCFANEHDRGILRRGQTSMPTSPSSTRRRPRPLRSKTLAPTPRRDPSAPRRPRACSRSATSTRRSRRGWPSPRPSRRPARTRTTTSGRGRAATSSGAGPARRRSAWPRATTSCPS